MARKLPKKDVVIIGLGWTGSIMANELTDEGLDVVAIERGPWRDAPTDFPPGYMQDELRYRVRHELFLRPDQTECFSHWRLPDRLCGALRTRRSCAFSSQTITTRFAVERWDSCRPKQVGKSAAKQEMVQKHFKKRANSGPI